MNYIAKAKEVLQIEIQGIQKISDELDERFNELVELCRQTLENNGKLVLSGIGKSGQIGQKMASTLSSTGSRATFLHPVEALHGDLGVLHENDLLIAMSYSGETEELVNFIPAVRRLGIKISSLTGNENSTLAQLSDICVPTPIEEEACPFNLAPTTTTTSMLALGDALAMVLMEVNGFDLRSYGQLHPSGAIGRSVTLKVKDIMRSGEQLATVGKEASVSQAVLAMSNSKGGTTIVCDNNNKLLGIFTTGDLKRCVSKSEKSLHENVEMHMTKNPQVINQDSMAVDILKILEDKKINSIPVLDEKDSVVGLIDIQDLPKFKVM